MSFWRRLLASDEAQVRYVGDLQRVQLQPGDVLVLRTERHISKDERERLCADIERCWPGHKAAIFSGGYTVGVIGDSPTDQP